MGRVKTCPSPPITSEQLAPFLRENVEHEADHPTAVLGVSQKAKKRAKKGKQNKPKAKKRFFGNKKRPKLPNLKKKDKACLHS